MLPLKDNIPTERFPFVTIALIVINIAVFLYELSLGARLDSFLTAYGMTPYEVTHGVAIFPRDIPVPLTLVTSIFVHGGLLHIAGNMLFLWIFGNNVEDSMGRFRFVVFYLLCGLLASLGQILIDPNSQVPNVGASGAIAGVLGGYLLLYPRAKVTTLIFLGIFITFVELPAVVVLLFWIFLQLFLGTLDLAGGSAGGGVAYFAHIGGFIAGLATIRFFTWGKGQIHIKRSQM